MLPEAGGILDQPFGLLDKMTYAMNVYMAVKSAKKSDNWAVWAKENPELGELFTEVSRMRDA